MSGQVSTGISDCLQWAIPPCYINQVSQANSASYPLRDGKLYQPSVVMLCSWAIKAVAHSTCA